MFGQTDNLKKQFRINYEMGTKPEEKISNDMRMALRNNEAQKV